MKIINKTGFPLYYVVIPSSSSLSQPGIIRASGTVNANSSQEFSLPGGSSGWINPGVYVGRQVASGDSTITVSFEEV